MTDKKELKIEFAPGCFDAFEGTQEELDEMVAAIHEMFAGKTAEEIEAMSQTVDIDELLEEEPEIAEQLLKQLSEEPKKLQ